VVKLERLGYKTLGMVVGLILGIIYVLVDILKNWLTAFDWTHALSTLAGFALLVIAFPLIPWIAHLIYRFLFNVEETAFAVKESKK